MAELSDEEVQLIRLLISDPDRIEKLRDLAKDKDRIDAAVSEQDRRKWAWAMLWKTAVWISTIGAAFIMARQGWDSFLDYLRRDP